MRVQPSRLMVTFMGALVVCTLILIVLQYRTVASLAEYDGRVAARDRDSSARREQLRTNLELQHRLLTRLCVNVSKTPAEAAECIKPLAVTPGPVPAPESHGKP